MKFRNPIARVVGMLRPKVVPDKKKIVENEYEYPYEEDYSEDSEDAEYLKF